MPIRLLAALTALLLAGFALTLNNAVGRSGTPEGNLWLLTSFILGVGLIAASLAAVASVLQARSQQGHEGGPPGGHTPPTGGMAVHRQSPRSDG
ncbi:MAG TPA: hypothetical protein VEB22_01445 [Phycisphaerales bacterium]|nr:hypothetical protein [Phycisphaerales bacterium]